MAFVPTEEEQRAADVMLGERHPLARALARVRTVSRQAVAVLALLPGSLAATVAGIGVAPLFLASTALVAVAYLVAWLTARRALLDRTQDVIARGEDPRSLGVVARERRRLVSRRVRERLARSLEQALDDAFRWERTPPPSRPRYGTQFLRDSAADVTAIARKLRAKRVRAQGVALVSRLLGDGERSPRYAGDSKRLHEELGRIRYLLEPPPAGRRLQGSHGS